MMITARFGPALIACATPARPEPPKPQHPILHSVPAIEMALASLVRLSKREAIQRGLTPEHDLEAQQFEREHGLLAALIADPVNEAIHFAASALYWRLITVLPVEEREACAARLFALCGPGDRYAADTRPRH